MRDQHDDDPAPTVKQSGDVEIERFSELEEGVLSEERENADEDPGDDDTVGE